MEEIHASQPKGLIWAIYAIKIVLQVFLNNEYNARREVDLRKIYCKYFLVMLESAL